jgi:hypothetical protein
MVDCLLPGHLAMYSMTGPINQYQDEVMDGVSYHSAQGAIQSYRYWGQSIAQ